MATRTSALSQPVTPRVVGWPALNTWLLGVLFVLSVFADIAPHAAFSYAALGAFVLFVVNMARNTPFTFAVLAGFLFLRATMFVSGIAIGSDAYMPEVTQFGAPSGAFLRLAMAYVFFMSVIQWYIEPRARSVMEESSKSRNKVAWSNINSHIWVWGFMGVCMLLWALAMYAAARDGFPLFTGSDKMAFRIRNADVPFFIATLNNRPMIVGFLGLIFWETTGIRRRAALGVYLAFGVLSVLCGEKFTSLLSMLVMFFIPVMLKMAKDYPWRGLKNQLPIVLVTLLACAITFPLMLRVYSGDEGLDAGITKFYERIASQGQLWYLADTDTTNLVNFDTETMQQEWQSWWVSNPLEFMTPPYTGLYNVMAAYAPPAVFSGNFDQGLGFTMAFESYLLRSFGWLGMVPILAIIAFLYAAMLRYWMHAIFAIDPISLFLALKMQVWVKGALVDGDLYFMFGYKMLILVLIAVMYEKVIKAGIMKPRP